MTEPTAPAKIKNEPSPWWLVLLPIVGLLFFGGRFLAQQQGWIAKGSMNGSAVAEQVTQRLERQIPGSDLTVICPDVPIQKNKTTDCTVTSATGQSDLFITVTDVDGHFNYEVAEPATLYP